MSSDFNRQNAENLDDDGSGPDARESRTPRRSSRFWGIFASLCILAFICALDVIIISTALPTITAVIGGGSQYVWIANSFVVASAVVQPLVGQLADIFGRQNPLIACTALFVLGSGIAGGASSAAMLIGGRTVQGVGAGGLYVLLDIVCCDLVPLRERGKYVGLMNSFAGVAAALGPPVGGAIAQTDWRWIFYLNIPICGVALCGTFLFMRMKKGSQSQHTGKSRLLRIDYVGNSIFIPSAIAVLLGLVMGGVDHPWSSWQVILPLVLGGVGWIAFHIQQKFTSHPSLPGHLFGHRTSAIGLILTFISSVVVQAIGYFLPVYFQALKGATVLESGTFFLPYAIGTLFFAVIGGILLAKLGNYKILHIVAFGLSSLGLGVFTLLDGKTPKVAWVFFELISSAGLGITVSTMLPAIMSALAEADVASITAAYSFIKTFGYVWGVTIASVIFNAAVNANLALVSDPAVRDRLRDGQAYAFASEVHSARQAGRYSPQLWDEVGQVYARSLRVIWWTCLGFSLVGLLLVFGERTHELRDELETEYGLEEKEKEMAATAKDGTLTVTQPSSTQR
ncbi:MFS general substrate transporter [Durotheca rogersii]|uniref:MFS general substrate transporter n=1 Tax=Durotheca rogersii TaxID=419775 RepID=UPI00221FD04E|nr:MFS general substrate transporter [Durotheca rogersii]KAI5865349.1 MFS general substrate transporter [Durotheca rogersii]